MKRIVISAIIILGVLSCEVNTNTKSNNSMPDGVTIKEDGLKCSDFYIEIGDQKVDRTDFEYGEEVYFTFDGVSGFVRDFDLVYPGLSVEIINAKTKEIVLERDDLFNGTEGYSEKVLLLYSNVVIALPYKNNEEYIMKINIWDKIEDGTLAFEMPFKVVENENFNVKENEVTYAALYLWNGTEDKFVSSDNIKRDDQLYLIYEGLSGFVEHEGMVYPEMSLTLIDDNGKTIIENDNLLKDFTKNGMTVEQFNTQVYIEIEFYDKKYANPLKLTTVLTDSNSDSKLTLRTDIEVY